MSQFLKKKCVHIQELCIANLRKENRQSLFFRWLLSSIYSNACLILIYLSYKKSKNIRILQGYETNSNGNSLLKLCTAHAWIWKIALALDIFCQKLFECLPNGNESRCFSEYEICYLPQAKSVISNFLTKNKNKIGNQWMLKYIFFIWIQIKNLFQNEIRCIGKVAHSKIKLEFHRIYAQM